MLSPAAAGDAARYWYRSADRRLAVSRRHPRLGTITRDAVGQACQKGAPAQCGFPSRSRRIRCATPSPPTCWSPAPTCARIQLLLGHRSLATTARYLRIATTHGLRHDQPVRPAAHARAAARADDAAPATSERSRRGPPGSKWRTSSAATARPIVREHDEHLEPRAAPRHDRDRALPHGGARRPRRAVRRRAATSASPTTAAGIGTARSASRWRAPQWLEDRQAELLDGPVLPRRLHGAARRSPPSPTRTRRSSTTSCSARPPRPCARSPPTPSIWAPRSASSPCCTPGARTCCTIRTCTASCRAVDSRRTARGGSPAGPASSCRCGCCRGCFAGCSWSCCSRPSTTANCSSSRRWPPCRDRDGLRRYLAPVRTGRVGRLRQEALRRARAGSGLRRALHASRGDLQQPPARHRRRHRSLSLEGLSPRVEPQETMTLDAEEFIRRFLLHVLPAGFQRIRYYGFLGNRHRARNSTAAGSCWA